MKKLSILITFLIFIACSNSETASVGNDEIANSTTSLHQSLLKASKIPSQFFKVIVGKDLSIKTKGGASIFIAKDALESKKMRIAIVYCKKNLMDEIQ